MGTVALDDAIPDAERQEVLQ